MLNTIPQDPSSVMRFVDGADERQLMSMVSSKNPYSFMALAKLQSIRDAKMKEQAGQPMPPPMSEQIPQQLAQLASGQQPQPMQQQPQQQPMQQPQQQPMPQQPMQPPMQPQGIASIGGEPNGAGGGMVSFTDGGGVRRFAEKDGDQLVPESNLGMFFDSISNPFRPLGENIASILSESVESVAENERKRGIRASIKALEPGLTEQLTPIQRGSRMKQQDYLRDQLNNPPFVGNTTPSSAPKPVALNPEKKKMVNAGAAEKQVPAVVGNPSPGVGNLDPTLSYKDYEKKLTPLFKQQEDAANAGITAIETAQKAMLPYYDEKRLAELNPTNEARETLRQTKQTELEKAFPNPYTKTANALELLQKNLENAEGNTFNKALFKASLTLMGSKSPKFFQAAAESGLVGVEDYGRMQEANQKQRMALMNADTALATAQDSRKRGLYDQSAKQVSESLQFKKDAFLAEREATFEKGKMAIALKGEEAKIPALKIQQAQDLHTLQHNLLNDQIKIAELNLKGQQIAATAMPEMAKMLNWAGNRPGRLSELHDAKRREFFVKAATIAESALSKLVAANPMATEAEKKASYEGTLSTVMASYDKDYPRPVRVP